ncbi:c-type cytochrome [Gemmatimonas groenlandica]|uniref:C-type cytochrome n=1 Tax=Gemmatimonas groenlandica TaxID=2732249 RepID=A0A6M4IIW9_9BACT|nr:c-type cytochrome [Gemmatimonas groenlandica]QJR35044.1 c-type cytochrome [Gemmatimonas groenlandica]
MRAPSLFRSIVSLLLTPLLIGCAEHAPAPTAGNAERGLALVTAFRDSLPEHSGNALRCVSCHLDNGTRPTAMSWQGTAARYPRYRARPGYEETLARRVNECIARSLAGRMLPEDGQDMRDMLAYLETMRSSPRPAPVDSVKLVGVAARGDIGYAGQCARCHGAGGAGVPAMAAPAVWGSESYAIGAGMARQYTLATFIRHNMPFDHADTLTAQEAADIAAFVLTRPRQDHPGKERDWPKGDPPVDVAYATTAAAAAGKPMPPDRPLLARRVSPDSLLSRR